MAYLQGSPIPIKKKETQAITYYCRRWCHSSCCISALQPCHMLANIPQLRSQKTSQQCATDSWVGLGYIPFALLEGQKCEQGCTESAQAQEMWPSRQEPYSTNQEDSIKFFDKTTCHIRVKIHPRLSFPSEVERGTKKCFCLDL